MTVTDSLELKQRELFSTLRPLINLVLKRFRPDKFSSKLSVVSAFEIVAGNSGNKNFYPNFHVNEATIHEEDGTDLFDERLMIFLFPFRKLEKQKKRTIKRDLYGMYAFVF